MTNPDKTRKMPTLVKLAVEIGPLAVFFIANGKAGIFSATMAFMVAISVALVVAWMFERRIPTLPLVTGIVVMVFGGLTLWLQDETFIKLKPTIVNACFALAIFTGLALKRNYVKTVMGAMMNMDDEGWRKLAWRWAFFFVAMALVNEAVWRNFSTDIWVNFKVFGFLPITFVFAMLQVPMMSKHAIEEEGEKDDAAA
jgi:intracellular septation protein